MRYSEYKKKLSKDREAVNKNISHIKLYATNAGYQIITHFRRCQYLRSKKNLVLLYVIERFLYRRKCVKYGCDLPSGIEVGSGFRIDHPWGVVINSQASIVNHCTIKTGAVIGKNDKGVPQIGNNVMIGAHALIIGNIIVGDTVKIGAGAIVTHDIPDGSIAICQPACLKDRGE